MSDMSTMMKLRERRPELWELYGKELTSALSTCAKTFQDAPHAFEPDEIQARMEASVERCTSALVERAALPLSFTSTCVMEERAFITMVFYHEEPVHKHERNECCVHLGVVHIGLVSTDVWFCPHSEMFHPVSSDGTLPIPRAQARHVEGPLGAILRAAERLMQKRPELLAQPDENGYVN